VPITEVLIFRAPLPVRAYYFTDPASAASWATEPILRRLIVEFAGDLSITYVMGGLAREFPQASTGLVGEWLDAAGRSGMPLDPRIWLEAPLSSSYPACMAVKAAAEQGPEAEERCLRALREGIMCFRRKLDNTEAIVEEARRAGLDVARFRVDLGSHAIVEAFGADLERARGVSAELPSLQVGNDGWVGGEEPYPRWRDAVVSAGGTPAEGGAPSIEEALARFGSMSTAEVAAVCDLPGPRAAAELWRLASEWRVKPERVLTGELWSISPA
jgi:predicted DsbA family dithiol-disulfide isomerase